MKALGNVNRLLLALILIAGALLRFYDLDWDQGQHTHPDERWIAMVAPTISWPKRAADLFDPRRSTLNPLWVPNGQGGGSARNFAYGHLPLYLHALVGHSLAALGERLAQQGPDYRELAHELRAYSQYGAINVVGRVLSALFDLGTIYLVYLLGRRIYDGRTALLAAALVTFAVTHVQLSHFSTFDVITTFFITLSVYGSVCVVQARGRSVWPTIWAGAAAGLAVASKFSAAPLVAVLVVAQLIRAARHTAAGHRYPALSIIRRSWDNILLSLSIVVLAFILTSPFAVLDYKLYLKQIVEQGSMVRGTADWPFTRQYRNTIPFLYQIVQQVRWGLGWPLGIAAFAGFGWTVVRQFRRARAEELVLLGWAVPYALLTGSFMVKFMRYMLPLLPLFILMGAAMLWQIAKWASRQSVDGTSKMLDPEGDEPESARSPIPSSGGRSIVYRLLSALPYIVLVASVLWTLAFMRVYAQTHPWIQASRWIYEHVPDRSVIAVEHWDDNLPLALPEERSSPHLRGYTHIELPMYEPDSYNKLMLVRDRLREADYVVFATNRLYRTIPRLPERYPVSTEFYRLFFEEKLGYVKEAEFTAYPGLLGLQIRDDDADESFTVYDHPKPIVYRKERDLDDAEWNALFASALAKQPVWEPEKKGLFSFLDREPTRAGEEERTLLLDRPVGELPLVADFGWNTWASESTVGATFVWWLVVALLGWLAWPLTFAVFDGLRDRGYLLARALSLLLVGYLIWLPTSLHVLKNGLPITYAAIGVLALVSALLLWRTKAEMAAFLRDRWRIILLGEAIFMLAYLVFVGIRVLNPDLWQPWNGGEKSMDIAYFNACLRSAYWPPYDPYFSDGYLNYYYYGQFLMSILARLTGIKATVAFNLAVPTFFALTVSTAFSIGYTLAGKVLGRERRKGTSYGIGHGLLAALCVAVFGNLASATQIIERLGRMSRSGFSSQIPGLQAVVRALSGASEILLHDARVPAFSYWAPSRVVGATINEFPYWSFLFADMHPHMMNLPFTLLAIALALNWLLRKPTSIRASSLAAKRGLLPNSELSLVRSSFHYLWQRLDWGELLNWVIWPICLGALWAINSWDWPAYAGFSGLVLLIVWIRVRGRQGVVPALLASVALAASSLVLYAPFLKYYTAIFVGFGLGLTRGYTLMSEFLTVWGFSLFLACSLLLILFVTQRSRWVVLRYVRIVMRYFVHLPRVERLYNALAGEPPKGYLLSYTGLAASILVVIGVAWKGYWVLALMLPLLGWAALLLADAKMPDERRFVLALVFTAFLLIVGVEVFYLKDHLDGGDAWRMNTLFKFYLQVWVMIGVAVGASLPEIWQAVGHWRAFWRVGWTAVFTLLLVAVILYPAMGTPARVVDRFPGERPPIGTLDGMAFMTVGTYTWPNENNPIHLRGDYDAILWLNDNVKGTPVLAEAPIGYYREFGVRVASYTGLPTLKGMHESEQRWGLQVGRRSGKANEFFNTADLRRTMDIARELGIEYVYVGPLERTQYPLAATKFDQLAFNKLLSVVYQNDQVTIYEVVE